MGAYTETHGRSMQIRINLMDKPNYKILDKEILVV